MGKRRNTPYYGWLVAVPPWTFTIVVLAGIIWLTLGKPPSPPDDIRLWEHTDKIVHAVMFGTLFFAMALDWYRRHPMERPALNTVPMYIIFPWVLVAGAAIELIQPGFGRTGDLWDFLADAAGAILAWLITPSLLRSLYK